MNNVIKWPIIGNDHVSQYLEKILQNDDADGAYIFNGPDNLGKTTTALYFAKLLSCVKKEKYACRDCLGCQNISADEDDVDDVTGKDLYFIKKNKDKKNISIEQVRILIKSLSLSSFSGGYKVGIIKHADALSEEAANALLKTLEEPRKKVLIILITDNLGRMLKTIISRSRIINFRPVSTDLIYDHLLTSSHVSHAEARSVARRCSGRPALAAKFVEDAEFSSLYKQRLSLFIEIFLSRDISSRLSRLEGILDKDWSNQESVAAVKRVFDIWLAAARDIANFHLNVKYLIQNEELEKACLASGDNIGLPKVLELIRMIERGRIFLDRNVNPKLVLENIVINF